MPKKTDSKRKARGTKKTDAEEKPTQRLAALEAKDAFHFYEAVDKPTGEIASGLSDLAEKLKTTKLESLLFHFHRGDFSSWIKNALGDAKLAEEIENIRISHGNRLRTSTGKALENRIRELSRTSVTVEIAETPPITN